MIASRSTAVLAHLRLRIDVSGRRLAKASKKLDTAVASLRSAAEAAGFASATLHISLWEGSLLGLAEHARRCEAGEHGTSGGCLCLSEAVVTLIEVIEHMEPQCFGQVGDVILGQCRPRQLIVTTPNRDWNPTFAVRSAESETCPPQPKVRVC